MTNSSPPPQPPSQTSTSNANFSFLDLNLNLDLNPDENLATDKAYLDELSKIEEELARRRIQTTDSNSAKSSGLPPNEPFKLTDSARAVLESLARESRGSRKKGRGGRGGREERAHSLPVTGTASSSHDDESQRRISLPETFANNEDDDGEAVDFSRETQEAVAANAARKASEVVRRLWRKFKDIWMTITLPIFMSIQNTYHTLLHQAHHLQEQQILQRLYATTTNTLHTSISSALGFLTQLGIFLTSTPPWILNYLLYPLLGGLSQGIQLILPIVIRLSTSLAIVVAIPSLIIYLLGASLIIVRAPGIYPYLSAWANEACTYSIPYYIDTSLLGVCPTIASRFASEFPHAGSSSPVTTQRHSKEDYFSTISRESLLLELKTIADPAIWDTSSSLSFYLSQQGQSLRNSRDVLDVVLRNWRYSVNLHSVETSKPALLASSDLHPLLGLVSDSLSLYADDLIAYDFEMSDTYILLSSTISKLNTYPPMYSQIREYADLTLTSFDKLVAQADHLLTRGGDATSKLDTFERSLALTEKLIRNEWHRVCLAAKEEHASKFFLVRWWYGKPELPPPPTDIDGVDPAALRKTLRNIQTDVKRVRDELIDGRRRWASFSTFLATKVRSKMEDKDTERLYLELFQKQAQWELGACRLNALAKARLRSGDLFLESPDSRDLDACYKEVKGID